mmetsp:Transcript_26692/g.79291  ORF Transcript_26692/g.79291 Transcript_26692/m.79291 type:complete len:276 (-) Transcript_26692:756-1583(-)
MKRRIEIFSPIDAMASLTACSIVLESSMRNGCGNNAIVCASLATRPSAILARMASGFAFRSSRCISISFSLSNTSAGMSSAETYCTSGDAAICIAMPFASWLNWSPAATKSVSQLISIITPRREPGWMYEMMAPSAAMRPAFLSAPDRPFLRSHSVAAVRSLLLHARAFLQSIMPAPVAPRNSLTVLALTATVATASSSFLASSFFLGSSGLGSDALALACVCSATSAAKSVDFFSMPSPSWYLTKRRICTFSPVAAIVSLTISPTVLVVSRSES